MEKRKKVRVIHESEVLPDGWLDTISAEIPLDNIGDAASNTFYDWAIDVFNSAYIDWDNDTLHLEYTVRH